ncbi:hypothetical protein A3F66_03125 [candidate division TM6 bacterium RIFCSPHIGHO2_12_FULL_32_22]|nr:MAG: hypothetical protein A3F66_03125 [candidate division TM6 bacterium RIFCSPHIGHO2_12_FULL_32_22]
MKISRFILLSISLSLSGLFAKYNTAGVLPYLKNGRQVLVLIGKEHRRDQTNGGHGVWTDFRGLKDKADNNDSFVTALREFSEESAHAVPLCRSRHIRPQYKGVHTHIYILPVQHYVHPVHINSQARRHRAVEKYDWTWVDLRDLLKKAKHPGYHLVSTNGKQVRTLYNNFEKVLNYKQVRRFLKSL